MTQAPLDIKFHQKSQYLEVIFAEHSYQFSAEFLRVYSPSAEVRGHGGGPLKLVAGKKQVRITNLKPVGHYAIQITFDDGHDSGLYTWQTFQELGAQQETLWQNYLNRLQQEHASREPNSEPKFKKIT
ncbi:DUF971 domain-containing protein [Pleionea litopenaei]|uniref:DUF971 domain-containing protein n=1 Tax=Pleionea litopenaei TaxID=3070815 RepID=A0AA51RS08_9GAMM|nr:DUF971 domain-containing protein [Pleionea sp. HL-JVS1]WMS86444.1 DUF971 domain-containing protein [Pleionea sp. HL-JVS1]